MTDLEASGKFKKNIMEGFHASDLTPRQKSVLEYIISFQ